jgi:hypothetical protein
LDLLKVSDDGDAGVLTRGELLADRTGGDDDDAGWMRITDRRWEINSLARLVSSGVIHLLFRLLLDDDRDEGLEENIDE